MKFTERFAKTFQRFMKFSERFVKTFERFMKITEQFVKTFERFMQFPIEIIFSRELSVVHGYLFGILTKPFEGCSVLLYTCRSNGMTSRLIKFINPSSVD